MLPNAISFPSFALLLAPALAGSDARHPEQVASGTTEYMKAVVILKYGSPARLEYTDVARPTPGDGELLVRVHAAGVNPIDDKVRAGLLSEFMHYSMPLIVGWDVAGVVESTGKNVTRFKSGDAIFAYMNLKLPGAYAEYAIVRESEACPKPAKLSFVEAAAVPLAAMTAWQALVDTAKLEKGQTVLIHGAAGGVGTFAVQIAKARGARVIGTSSPKSLDFLRELGVDEAIDYTSTRFEDAAKNVDVVLDPIGGDTQARSFGVLKKGGILVSIVEPPDQTVAKEKGVRATIMLAHPDAGELAELAKLLDAGKLKPIVSKVYPLHNARGAHEQIATKHTRGKLVLEVVPEAAAKAK
jgi:NADPH:quinone reductase-like Zn-dependent oxidoreductase